MMKMHERDWRLEKEERKREKKGKGAARGVRNP